MPAQTYVAPISSAGDEPQGCSGLLARARMYRGRVDVMLPPSIFFFARNVLVTAPDISIAYKRPPAQTATAGSPSQTHL